MRDLATLTLAEIRSRKEGRVRPLMLAAGVLGWVAILVTIVGGPIALATGAFVLMGQALFIAWVRGNAVRVGPEQLPALHARVVAASQRLGLASVPEVFVLQAGGSLNALAMRLLSRNFVILFSDLVDACGDDERALDFVVGHELAHHALGHLRLQLLVAPAQLVPWLAPAYSRACEYSCDIGGLATCGDAEAAQRGLVVLAAGGKVARAASLARYAEQARDTGGFWAAVLELNLSHPFLSKRVLALRELMVPGTAPAPARNPLAYPLAPVFSFMAAGFGGAGSLVGMFVLLYAAIIAALAVPEMRKQQALAKQAEGSALVEQCRQAQSAYRVEHRRFATTFAQLGIAAAPQHYTLYMGKEQIGAGQSLPAENWRGYARPKEGYVCVAAANLDDDAIHDLWVVTEDHEAPAHWLDDLTNFFDDGDDAVKVYAELGAESEPQARQGR